MTHTLYFLLSNPTYLDRLRAEVDTAFDENNILNIDTLPKLRFLSACLNEVLRLVPGVPSGGPRSSGDTGVAVLGEFIPPNTTVTVVIGIQANYMICMP